MILGLCFLIETAVSKSMIVYNVSNVKERDIEKSSEFRGTSFKLAEVSETVLAVALVPSVEPVGLGEGPRYPTRRM